MPAGSKDVSGTVASGVRLLRLNIITIEGMLGSDEFGQPAYPFEDGSS